MFSLFSDILYYNEDGEAISFFFGDFRVSKIDGISPANEIYTRENSGYSGSSYISEHISTRNITMEIYALGNKFESRKTLNSFFAPYKIGKLIFVLSDGNVRSISARCLGIVFPTEISNGAVTINLVCTNPLFSDDSAHENLLIGSENYLEFDDFSLSSDCDFEFSYFKKNRTSFIENYGDLKTGCVFEIRTSAVISNVEIINETNGQRLKINGEISPNEIIFVNTINGEKSVTSYDLSSAVSSNITNRLDFNSDFIELETGENTITVNADGNIFSLAVNIKFASQFGGI